MKKFELLVATALVAFPALPASAQSLATDTPSQTTSPSATQADTSANSAATSDIIITAQRQSQRLQDVPIAVSAFGSAELEKQQIKTTSDLQLTLPNVSFTKTNFTGASFTIRGVGDLCTGVTCDSATAIALNDQPLFATRLFEGEFYDLSQIQVLRGPQGTLFGRNATSGVVDFETAKPTFDAIEVAGEGDYGNYNSRKVKGMINIPLGSTLAVRAAGFYLKRDGYTRNLYDNSKIDNRDEYGFRGSIRWQPTSGTTIDLMAQYFHERDNRMRIQKQLCTTDPTGILGCLNGVQGNGLANGNATVASVLTSKEFLATQGIPAFFALGSLYGPDAFTGALNPLDPRQVYSAYNPQYYTRESIFQGSIDQQLGDSFSINIGGTYQNVAVDSSQDYNNALQNRAIFQPALNSVAAAAGGAFGAALPAAAFTKFYTAIAPQGAAGPVCTSAPEPSGTGIYGGHSVCSTVPLSFDRSDNFDTSYSGEAILSSKFDGPFNFLLGGIYAHLHNTENSYYVDSFGLDYFSGLIGALSAGGAGYLGTPTYRNNTTDFRLSSYGVFGETYFKFSNQLKLTLGLRYNHDKKTVSARTTLLSFIVPFGVADAFSTPLGAGFDADPSTPCAVSGSGVPGAVGSVAGCEGLQTNTVSFGRVTGRAVLDFQLTNNNLLYLSYSRGYKSGGINPPLSPIFSVATSFSPESIDAYEIGSKNQFGGLTLNATAFYYKYKDLQLSRIVARTSVNDNVNANIYGVELEAIMRPVRAMTVNANFSYLHATVSNDKLLSNPRDFGGGRSDAVIIKDITNGANCAVAPNTVGNAAGANAFVNYTNTVINAGGIPGLKPGAGLRGTTPFPANGNIASTGAHSICAALQGVAAAGGKAFDPAGLTVYTSGIPVNIRGNTLPGAPNFKASAGVQYEIGMGSDYSLTPRFDAILTGTSYGSVFNGVANRIPSYTQLNAQVQFDSPGHRWYVRGYIQNISNSNAVTGQYVTDQSSGNYTNIFTLDPRRYGAAVGFKF